MNWWAAALVLLVSLPGAMQAGDAARGREIYLNGALPGHPPILCSIGENGAEIPAAVLACVKCHGQDGRGRAEGGVTPANIRWSELTKPYASNLGSRRRSPYTTDTLRRALVSGLDSDGRVLPAAMPRYRLTEEQAGDLVAWLRKLESGWEPGVTEDEIVIGLLQPPAGVLDSAAEAIRETLTAQFGEVNRRGGIYGRRLRLSVQQPPLKQRVEAWEKFLRTERPFALLESFAAGEEEQLFQLIERERVPFVQPVGLYCGGLAPSGRYTFFLRAGLETQCAVLVRHLATTLGERRTGGLLVVHERSAPALPTQQAIQHAGDAHGLEVSMVSVPAEAGAWEAILARHRPAGVLWLSPGHSPMACLQGAAQAGLRPALLLPGGLMGSLVAQLPPEIANPVFVACPSLPQDQSAAGRAELAALIEAGKFGGHEPAVRSGALASGRLVLHLLESVGRELTRERFVEQAEQLRNFDSQHLRPVTFGAGRRIGSSGAYVMEFHPGQHRFRGPAIWCEVLANSPENASNLARK